MVRRTLFWSGSALLLLCIALYIALVPAQSLAVKAWVWTANETPSQFEAAIKESGWQVDPNRKYYMIHYFVTVRSLLPFRLALLHARPSKALPDIRIHALTPDFARDVRAFQKTGLTLAFIVEAPQNRSASDIAKQIAFAIYSGENAWPRIAVKQTPGFEIVEHRP